jgi:hypothetical protein
VLNGNDDDSWFEDFVGSIADTVTGFIDAVSQLVNFAADLWEKLKKSFVGVVADAISATHILNCDSACQAALEGGLEIGMAAMGVPPSIPNFDQLMEQGTDYLVAQAAEQTGVPEVVAQQIADKGKDFVKNTADGLKDHQGSPGLPDWLAIEVGLDPAVLTVYVAGPGTELPTKPAMYRNSSDLFIGSGLMPLPRNVPSSPWMAVPMVLQPDLEGLPELPPTCFPTLTGEKVCQPPSNYAVAIWNKKHWVQQRLNGACATFDATFFGTKSNGDAAIYSLLKLRLLAELPKGFVGPTYQECTP